MQTSLQTPNLIHDLKPQADDLIVVPEDMVLEVPEGGFPFHVYAMKFLHAPSIIRSGGYSMNVLDRIRNTSFGTWLGQNLGLKPTEPDSNFIHYKEDEPPKEIMDTLVEPQGVSLGLSPDNTIQPADVRSTDLPRFWRYERPTDLVEYLSGSKIVVSPKGGVGFYIELDAANKTFAFSYALCHNNDNFNYALARQISKGRFDDGAWYEVKNYDDSKSIVENIGVAICNFLYTGTPDEAKDPVFSSTPDKNKVSLNDLREIYKRI